MIKERLSSDYMFFRFPSHYALILGPLVAGVTNFFINSGSITLEASEGSSILLDKHYEALSDYFQITKLALAVMCAFFITYRWTVINKDGSYGYMLTQGIDRGKFFIRSAYMFLVSAYAGILAGILILNYLGGINLAFDVFIWVVILSFSSTLLIVSTAIFLGELLSLPELSSLIVVLIFGLNINLNTSKSSIWFKLLQSDLLFADNNPIIPFVLSFGLGSVFMVGGYILHKKSDVEL